MRLDGFVGNQKLVSRLTSAKQLPHAVILGGPAGSGRHTLALRMAQQMVCLSEGERPCLQCSHCRLAEEGMHPDVVPIERFLTPDQLKKDLKVDAVRSLRADAYIRPNQAGRKVYLISRADSMNLNAQNALLKVLEDGPDYAAFLLLAENPMVLLETIRSRCVRYDLSPVSEEEVYRFLRRRLPQREEGQLRAASQNCGGIIGRALELAEGHGLTDPKLEGWLEQLFTALSHRSELELMEWSVKVQNEKCSREQLTRLYERLPELTADILSGRRQPSVGGELRLSPTELMGVCRLAREGSQAMLSNVSPAHSLGWLAAELCDLVEA